MSAYLQSRLSVRARVRNSLKLSDACQEIVKVTAFLFLIIDIIIIIIISSNNKSYDGVAVNNTVD